MKAEFSADKFHEARTRKNVTQERLAEQTDISTRYIRALESGSKHNPSAAFLCRIALALDLPMDALMDITEKDTPSK